MLSAEQNYFIQIIKDYLNIAESKNESDIDWNKLFFIFKQHQLCGILNNQCNKFINNNIKKSVFDYSVAEMLLYQNRLVFYEKIKKKFTEEKISFISVKGLNVAKYYPIPQNRTMGDCDIIVNSSDLKKSDRIMKELGFELKKTPDFEDIYKRGNICFEIHSHLLYDEIANTRDDIRFCDTVWDVSKLQPDSTELLVDESFHFVFLLLHLKKHLIHKGAGFRQFIDIYLLAKNSNLNWDYINDALEKLNLKKFATVCAALTLKWFDGDSSYFGFPIINIDDEFFYSATEKIFANGIFGYLDEANNKNTRLQYEINKQKFTLTEKIISKIRIVFPSYNDLRFSPRYSFIDKKPWLLPIVWVYRIFYNIFNKPILSSKSNEILNDEIINRKKFLDNFGLL